MGRRENHIKNPAPILLYIMVIMKKLFRKISKYLGSENVTSQRVKIFDQDESHDASVTKNEINSNFDNRLRTESTIAGLDDLGSYRRIGSVVRADGITAMPIDGVVTVQSTFGADPLPDTHFKIINTGATGSTLTVGIKGTSVDPSSPDRDLPDYSKTFTVQAGEVGDELALRDRIVSELNLDSIFKNTCLLKAIAVSDRAIVHISSTAFSLSGEFYQRPFSGDFYVNVTGDAVVKVVYDNIISRSKPVVLDRDPNNPHRSGVFGISGSVFITPKELSDIFIQDATHPTYGTNLLQNGSITPIEFYIYASPDTDVFIEHLIFHCLASSIKFGQFFGKSTALTLGKGVVVEIKSENVITTFPELRKTEDFKNKWAAFSGDVSGWAIDSQPSLHDATAVLNFSNPFVLKVSGSFGIGNDDYIKVSIRDNLTSGNLEFEFRCKGFEKEP